MPATNVSDPPSLSFARHAAKPVGVVGKGPQRPPQQIASRGRTQEDLERELRELRLLVQAQQSPPQPVNQYGYPRPGPQSPTPDEATGRHYFVDEPEWQEILDYGEFDDIVCGSAFCALAYIDAAYKLNPHRKILVLERGGFWLPSHFQNLPLPFNLLLGGSSETFPWSLTSTTFNSKIEFLYGSVPFFGGRSTFWSGWSPRPSLDLLRGFPPSMIRTATPEQFWKDCKDLLHVVKATELHNEEYQILQKYIDGQLETAVAEKKIPSADFAEASDLAVGRTTALSTLVFEKFSTPGPLLDIYERQRELAKAGKGSPLKIATDVVVTRFDIDPDDEQKRANVLYTSRGDLSFPRKKPNIILATGTLPNCTIVQNSIEEQRTRAGSRFSGHFMTQVFARFPIPTDTKDKFERRKKKSQDKQDHLELAASYLAGHDRATGLQYHSDITSLHSPHPETDAADVLRLSPNYFATPSKAQLIGSEGYIIVACDTLGEMEEKNPNSWAQPNPKNPDVTTNIRLQFTMSAKDTSLCKVMYVAILQAIEAMAGEKKPGLQYWHDNGDGTGYWEATKPDISKFLSSGICHESSTLYMSDDIDNDKYASVDSNYLVKGSGNVYATGASIFPTSGSWNPVLTTCGFTQDLAKKLSRKQA